MLGKYLTAVALCVCTVTASSARAERIYQLVDYPELQEGHTVTGTITTTDDAPNDGLLDLAEILDWEWEVRNGLEVTTGQMHPTEPHSSSLTEVANIEIDSQGVYFSHELGQIFKLQINTNTSSRGSLCANIR